MSNNPNEINIIEPPHCRACQFKPVVKNNDDQVVSVENMWIIVPIPNSVVWFYVCPKCGMVMPNDNAIENVEKLIEMRQSKIVRLTPKLEVPKGVIKSDMN